LSLYRSLYIGFIGIRDVLLVHVLSVFWPARLLDLGAFDEPFSNLSHQFPPFPLDTQIASDGCPPTCFEFDVFLGFPQIRRKSLQGFLFQCRAILDPRAFRDGG
jgi:hypothetical protein